MDFSDFGWRDAILLLIALFGVYLVVLLLRFAQIKRRIQRSNSVSDRYAEEPDAHMVSFSAAAAGIAAQFAFTQDAAAETQKREPVIETDPQAQWYELKSEVLNLRAELYQAQEQLGRLQEEMTQLQVRSGSSPLYNEAMAMATRGIDAAGIAGRCGISLGEAELVVALARKPTNTRSTPLSDEVPDDV